MEYIGKKGVCHISSVLKISWSMDLLVVRYQLDRQEIQNRILKEETLYCNRDQSHHLEGGRGVEKTVCADPQILNCSARVHDVEF